MTERRRTADRLALLAVGISLAALAITIVAFLVGLAAVGRMAGIEDFQRESNERRDQTCRLFETDHLNDVERLRNTYDYLQRLSPSELRQSLNQAILGQLPGLESEARTDSAPEFCDAPRVGLPEPDPVVPERPEQLGPLLEP